jgi:hypothetical protein
MPIMGKAGYVVSDLMGDYLNCRPLRPYHPVQSHEKINLET